MSRTCTVGSERAMVAGIAVVSVLAHCRVAAPEGEGGDETWWPGERGRGEHGRALDCCTLGRGGTLEKRHDAAESRATERQHRHRLLVVTGALSLGQVGHPRP